MGMYSIFLSHFQWAAECSLHICHVSIIRNDKIFHITEIWGQYSTCHLFAWHQREAKKDDQKKEQKSQMPFSGDVYLVMVLEMVATGF